MKIFCENHISYIYFIICFLLLLNFFCLFYAESELIAKYKVAATLHQLLIAPTFFPKKMKNISS